MNKLAFPLVFDDGTGTREIHSGMTLRDWFAGKAMQGIWSNATALAQFAGSQDEAGQMAVIAYEMADAMLKERSKE